MLQMMEFFFAIISFIQLLIFGDNRTSMRNIESIFEFYHIHMIKLYQNTNKISQFMKYMKLMIMHKDFNQYSLLFRTKFLYYFIEPGTNINYKFAVVQQFTYAVFTYLINYDVVFCCEIIDSGLIIKLPTVIRGSVDGIWYDMQQKSIHSYRNLNSIRNTTTKILTTRNQIRSAFNFNPIRYMIKNYSRFVELLLIQRHQHIILPEILELIISFIFI